jgi:A nuclease family of the HNH/ENDO VII superfamily with conserved AHH
LGNAIGAAVGPGGVTKQAHHIIPWVLRTHKFIQKAARDGFHMNDYPNGVRLNTYSGFCSPTGLTTTLGGAMTEYSFHNGSHQKYTDYVTSILDKYEASANYTTPSKAYDALFNGILPFLMEKLIASQNAMQLQATTICNTRRSGGSLTNLPIPTTLNAQYCNWKFTLTGSGSSATYPINCNTFSLPLTIPNFPL